MTDEQYIIQSDLQRIVRNTPELAKLSGSGIILTGACGFLGNWFTALIQYCNQNVFEKPCKMHCYDNYITGVENNPLTRIIDQNIRFYDEDVAKILYYAKFTETYYIHAAGLASPIYYREHPIESIEGIVFGLDKILKSAVEANTPGVLYFSTSEIYGNPDPNEVPMREEYNGNCSPIGPRACYDEAKRLGETMCTVYHKIHGVPVNWVRPFNVYGPGMRINDDRVVPKFIFAGLQDKPITVHLPGTQTRTFCYVTDAMTGFFKALLDDRKGDVYNIGNPEGEISMIDFADKVNNQLFDGKMKLEKIEMPQEYPADQAQRRCPSIEKAKHNLKYYPEISLTEGLERTKQWCTTILP